MTTDLSAEDIKRINENIFSRNPPPVVREVCPRLPLTFCGGIDTQLLPFGTPADIRREAARVIQALGKGGGHIIGPSQEVMKDVPLANGVALLETIVDERTHAMG